jgi:Trk K+ transport system NAD-binding subunit
MLCDVCNGETMKEQAIYVAPSRFRELLKQGFGIDESNISMLTDAGMSRADAVAALTAQYLTSQSFWVLCANCAAKAERLL